ncbi:Formimidoyltransferase-cyclodeaminase [Lamellibrachia satsuma]|nr:Formimidoyltransferase-cyclodeaminase [Lamellibrachia satsuma]
MAKLVECVPNFSEGQRKEVIEAIANAIGSTEGCNLLDVDAGLSTNRTVYTFVGPPDAVVEGALNGARAAAQLIDMTRHRGEHPRLGALDVCPFIPVQGVTMEECAECAREFGEKLADEFSIPVYLYGEAATEDYRNTVPKIRVGEYEGLVEKLQKPEWKPDYGPREFIPNWGATIVGARKFLIAYNINLLATKEQAHRIALNIREQGRGKDQPGRLKEVQALGWYLEEANLAQVSVNIMDFEVTPIHIVYEEVCKDAEELGLAVVGSQIVGLVPLKAVMDSADHYMEKEGVFVLEEDQKIRLLVDRLGLHSLGGFNPKDRVIEYMINEDKDGPLVTMSVRDFVMTVGARSATPGGGSVAAMVASLGTALGTMVSFLTYGNRKFAHLDEKMRKLLQPLYKTVRDMIQFIDSDSIAFSQYMMACKLPRDTEEEQQLRDEAMQRGLMASISVPMNLAKTTNAIWPLLEELADVCNINCKCDLQVGLRCLETGVYGAYYNVLTNLPAIKDDTFKAEIQTAIDSELKTAKSSCLKVLEILDARSEDK